MRKQIFALLIALTLLLSGCMDQESFETRDFESVVLSKDAYTTRRPVTTPAGKVPVTTIVTNHHYELYVMNPWDFNDPDIVYDVSYEIYDSVSTGDRCIVVAKLKDGKIIGTSLRGDKGLTGEWRLLETSGSGGEQHER